MRLYARPSKVFFFNVLARTLRRHTSGAALDAACAGFKNYPFFKTERYVGVDLDKDAVAEGLKKFPDRRTVGVVGDLRSLDSFPAKSFSVVVSTNTLDHLPAEDIGPVIASLARFVSRNGTLFLQFSLQNCENRIVESLKKVFKNVRVRHYRNFISGAYEKFFERNGNLGYHPLASSRPFLLLSFFISLLEYLTCFFRKLNTQAYIICAEKRETGAEGIFDPEKLHKIGERFYKIRTIRKNLLKHMQSTTTN